MGNQPSVTTTTTTAGTVFNPSCANVGGRAPPQQRQQRQQRQQLQKNNSKGNPLPPSVLLLGVGQAGKSTLYKALSYYNRPWKAGESVDLYVTLIDQLSLLVQALQLRDESFESLSSDTMRIVARQMAHAPDYYQYPELLPPYDCATSPSFITMWPTPTSDELLHFSNGSLPFDVQLYQAHTSQYTIQVQHLIELSNEPAIVSLLPCDYMESFMELNESTSYWWPKRAEDFFTKKQYFGTFEDFLRKRIRTSGIPSDNIYYPCHNFHPQLSSHQNNQDDDEDEMTERWNKQDANIAFKLTDTGNEPNERKKWIHAYGDVDIMMYVVSLADYSFVGNNELTELRSSQRGGYFADSVQTFVDVMRWFRQKTKIIICFNKYHHFAQKLSQRPFNQCFPDYHGDNSDPKMIIEWIKEQYINECKKNCFDIEDDQVDFIFIDPFDLDSMGKLILTIDDYSKHTE